MKHPDLIQKIQGHLAAADLACCTAEEFADQVGIPRRTIVHRLQQLGTTWRQLKREEKTKRLEAILAQPGRVNLNRCAAECGFDSPGPFLHFFKAVRRESFTRWRMARQVA